jgi:hypothetical protein
MSERDTPEAPEVKPREKLKAAIRNPLYQNISYGFDPLTSSSLREALEVTGLDSYLNPSIGVVGISIGWPDAHDRFEFLRRDYLSSRRFVVFWGGPISEGDHDALAQFPMRLRTLPPSAQDFNRECPPSIEGHPLWKIRLGALTPDLVEGVVSELHDIDDQQVMLGRVLSDQELLRALMMCYEIGGRLVKPDDDSRYAELCGADVNSLGLIPDTSDVHWALAGKLPLEK